MIFSNGFSEKWERRFLGLAQFISTWSKDPSTKAGAVIVDDYRRVVSHGYNGFPRGVIDSDSRYDDRDTRLLMVVHAEANALSNAPIPIRGTTLFCTNFPCNECAKLIIQEGIYSVVCPPPQQGFSMRWAKSIEASKTMFDEAGVQYRIYCS